MIQFPSKQPLVQTTIFTKMSQLATEEGALNLSQGFPGFDCSEELQDLLKFYAKGHNQYAPMAGVPLFRQRIAQKTNDFYGISLHADTEVTVVSGATEALFAAIHCCVSPGDEVIMFDPSYDAYDPIVRLAGGVPVHIPLHAASGFRIDWEVLARAITPKTRAIIDELKSLLVWCDRAAAIHIRCNAPPISRSTNSDCCLAGLFADRAMCKSDFDRG
jgi:methionine aminotransferase